MYYLIHSIILNIGYNCKIDPYVRIKRTKINDYVMILKGTELTDCNIGLSSFIGRNCSFNKTKIGKYCSIGESVKLIYGKHPTHKFVSTYPAFYSSEAQYGYTYSKDTKFEEFEILDDGNYLDIGNDVWIGSYAHIMGGIRIGDGAIIASGALITKDVEPYCIVGGIPAKKMKMRFSNEEIQQLISVKWWDKDREWISNHSQYFFNITTFLQGVNNE